jgi:hypothetical protein
MLPLKIAQASCHDGRRFSQGFTGFFVLIGRQSLPHQADRASRGNPLAAA